MSPIDLILRLHTQAFSGPLNKGRNDLGQFNKGLKSMDASKVTQTGSAFTGLATKIAAAFTAWQAGAALFGAARKSLNLAADLESTNVAFRTMIGNSAKALGFVLKIKKLGAETPFEFPELADSGRKLIAFGESADTVPETLRRIGDVASGVQAPIGEIAEIYGKARVQGTLFAEDINQLLGRGIPVIQQFARQLGVSEGQVKKLASEGKITFPLLEQAFINLTAEGGKFHGMMAQQSGTTNGLLSTLKDTVNEAFTAFGTPINDALKPILKDAIGLTGQLVPLAASLGQAMAPGLTAMREFVAEAGNGGNLIPMLGSRLKDAFMGVADIAMLPIRVLMAGLPALGQAMLSGISPVGEWLSLSLESAALKFGRTMMMTLHTALQALPRSIIPESALENLNKAANAAGKQGNLTGQQADVAAGKIMPGLEEAGKQLTKVVGDMRAEFKRQLEQLERNKVEGQARKIVQEGRQTNRESVGLIQDSKEGPFQPTFQSQMNEFSYGGLPPQVRNAPGKSESAPPATTPAPVPAPAPGALAIPSTGGRQRLSRYDENGYRRSDGRKKIDARQPPIPEDEKGLRGLAKMQTRSLRSTFSFPKLDEYKRMQQRTGQPPNPGIQAPGAAKTQDQRRETAAKGSQGDKARWDVVQKIEQHLGKLSVA